MAKRLFLLLFMSFIGVISSPNFLMADDFVKLTGVDDSKATETVIVPETPEEPVLEETSEVDWAVDYYAGPINYTVTIVTDQIQGDNLSYYDIYRTGQLIYAHNTSYLLGNIVNLGYSDVITVTENGVVKTYQVMDTAIYEKAANGYFNGDKNITRDVLYNAGGYDISLVTCYGTVYPNGDASHRFVVFANEF